MKEQDSSQVGFTSIHTGIRRSKKLTSTQKILISYLIGWQNDGKRCFQNNVTLAIELGVTRQTIITELKKLKPFKWFNSEASSRQNKYGKWVNERVLVIDVDLLNKWIEQESQEEETPDIPTNDTQQEATPDTSITKGQQIADAIIQKVLPMKLKPWEKRDKAKQIYGEQSLHYSQDIDVEVDELINEYEF